MEKENRPAFLFYAADFSAGTKGMDAATIGMYVLLLCYQWENGAIPNDEKQLWRIACADSLEHFRDAWALLKHKFSTAVASGKKGFLQNDKLEIVRVTSKEKDKARSDKAKAAAIKRWEMQRERERLENEGCSSNAQAMPDSMLNECSSNAIIENGNGDGNKLQLSQNSESSISVNRGMQGGNEKEIAPEFFQALYFRFIGAYGNLSNRPHKRDQILIELTRAIRDYLDSGVCSNEIEAATHLCNAAAMQKDAYTKMIQQGAKPSTVLNAENWLSGQCYHSNPTPETVEVLTPAQKRQNQDDEMLRKVFDQMQKDKEAQNASR